MSAPQQPAAPAKQAGPRGEPRRVTLSQFARQTSDQALAIIEHHDAELATRLSRMRATRPDKPTVVVVGEAKRGKSSLTNALINVPNLSPVDARVATSTYIMFRRGPQTAARALLPGNDEPVEIPLDRMRDWATDLGSRGETAPPRLIEVECDSPLLGNLNLVDTPGVGGLEAAHAEIALRAVGRATALLFVCDASAPFTKPELDFLVEASKNIDLVIFAVTKIDAYRGWRQIAEDNRALLRQHAPRFADAAMLPVSAKLFEQAALMGQTDLGQALREESNIIDLQKVLQEQVAIKSSALHEANLLRTMRSQLDGIRAALEDSRRACQPDEEYANRLKENRDRLLQARRADSRAWQLRLRSLLSRARLDTMADIQTDQRKFLASWRRHIEEADKNQLKQIGPALDSALKVASMRIFDRQQARMQSVSTNVLQSMFAKNELAEVYASLQRPRQLGQAVGPGQRAISADEKIITGMGVVSAISLGRIAMLPFEGALAGALGASAGLVIWPVVLTVGLGAGGWMIWARRTAADRNHLKVWLNEALGENRAKLEADASAFFIESEQELTLALDRALVRRIETLDGHIKQIDESRKVDRGERERRAAVITKQIAAVREVCSTIDQLLPRLRNAVVTRKPAASADGASADSSAAPAPAQDAERPAQPAPQPQPADQHARDTTVPVGAALTAGGVGELPQPRLVSGRPAAPPPPAPPQAVAQPAEDAGGVPRAPASVASMAAAAAKRLAERRAAESQAQRPQPAESPAHRTQPSAPALPPVTQQFGIPGATQTTAPAPVGPVSAQFAQPTLPPPQQPHGERAPEESEGQQERG